MKKSIIRIILLTLTLLEAPVLAESKAMNQIFGQQGRDGRNGYSGRDGRNGRIISVKAGDQYQRLDLSGTDGEDGRDGDRGYHANNCYQPHNTPYHLRGARGGNGGLGGQGGNGGHAGGLTVYYGDINELRNLEVQAVPGRGGRGGYGQSGGTGCYCQRRAWTITDQNGNQRTYYCEDGEMGRRSRTGTNGSPGRSGQITIIKNVGPLEPTRSTMKVDIENLENGPIELSANQWRERSGASHLFAASSRVNDRYTEFVKRIEASYRFDWQAPASILDFPGLSVFLGLNQEQVTARFDQDFWHLGYLTTDPEPSYVITEAITSSKATSLSFASIDNYGRDLSLTVNDLSNVSDLVATKFKVKYYTKAMVYYYLRHEAEVSEDLITRTGDQFSIDLGRMNISSKWLEKGRKALVKLEVERSLGDSRKTVLLEKISVLQ